MDAFYSNRRVVLILVAAGAIGYALQNGAEGPRSRINIGQAITSGALATSAPGYEGIVFTQAPAMRNGAVRGVKGALFPTRLGEGAHLAVLSKEGNVRTLTPDFESAADPAVSFDGKRILFAGKKSAKDTWNIFEVNVDGSGLRQITRDMGNCRSPIYQSALFYLNDPKPSYQITFVSDAARELNEVGSMLATNLYSIRMDGAGIRRLTYGISTSYDPLQMQDGRILFSHWQADRLQPGPDGRVDLFGIGLDGTDYAAFSGSQGKRVKQMACTTLKRKAVFVESETASWDGAGNLATLDLRRNFHSYRVVTTSSDGLFHSPSALPDGSILVSRRSAAGTDTHSIYRMDLQTGRRELLISDPAFENIQAVVLAPRPEPDGHSSVVEDDQDWSKLYCLSIRHTDLKPEGMLLEKAARIRVVEGVPVVEHATNDHAANIANKTVPRRLLGDTELDPDGSFHLSVPPNIPIQVQLLDKSGMALRSSSWFWTKNKENRGCIGCHEDSELTPENVFPSGLSHSATQLMLPPARRRTVTFRADVMPVLASKCATPACHGGGAEPKLSPKTGDQGWSAVYRRLVDPAGADKNRAALVDPGRARTSRLVWAILGRNTSQPWDKSAAFKSTMKRMPPDGAMDLTDDEKRIFIEWIDLGAQLDPISSPRPGAQGASSGGQR